MFMDVYGYKIFLNMELPDSTRLAEIHMVFNKTNIKNHHEMLIRSSVSIPEPTPGPALSCNDAGNFNGALRACNEKVVGKN